MHIIFISQCSVALWHFPPLKLKVVWRVNVCCIRDENEIELNDVGEVVVGVRVGQLKWRGIHVDRPEAGKSHSEARDLHCPGGHVQHPHVCGPHGHHSAQCDKRVGQ